MKKKNMYIGAFLLSLGLGFSAMAVNGLVPIPFAGSALAAADEGDTPEDPTPEKVSYLNVTSQSIADNASVASLPAVTGVWYDFDYNSDKPLPLGSGTITVTKDGAAFKSYEIGTAAEVYIDTENGSRLCIDFGAALKPGVYVVTVPEAAVQAQGSEADNETIFKNNEIVNTFTVIQAAYFNVTSQSIADNASVSSLPGVTGVWYNFGYNSDNSLPLGSGTITVTKDGEPFKSYEIGTSSEVYIDRNWTARLCIDFGAALEPGVYVVTVPEGAVRVQDIEASDSGSGTEKIFKNREIVNTFTVLRGFEYSVTPATGSKQKASALETITLTYPEGTTVSLNGTLELKHFNAGVTSVATTYSAAVEGNVVTLKAADVKAITPCTREISLEYYYLDVPSGAVKVTDSGSAYPQGAFTVGNWSVEADQAAIVFTPALDTPDLKISDIETITVELPENYTIANAYVEKGTMAFFTIYPNPVNTSYGYEYKIVSQDGKKYVCAQQRATSSGTAKNEPGLCIKGSTTLRFNSNILSKDGVKQGIINFDAYNLDGKEAAVIYNSTPGNGKAVTSIASLTLNFCHNTEVVNPDAVIELWSNGVLLASVKASETTTAKALPGAGGATSIGFSNKFKDNGANRTQPGVYVFKVPAGTFKDVTNNYLNEAHEIQAYIPGDLEYTVSPATCAVKADGTNYIVTPGSDEIFTSLEEVVLTYPNATKITLSPDLSGIRQNSFMGQVTYKNASSNKAPSNYTGYKPDLQLEVVGENQVKVRFNKYVYPTPEGFVVGLKIAKGAFVVYEKGADGVETQTANKDLILYYPGFHMAKPEIITPADLNAVTADDTYFRIQASGSIYSQTFGPNTDDGQVDPAYAPYIVNAAGEEQCRLKEAAVTDGLQTLMDLKIPAGTDLAPGNYKLIIPAHGLQGGNSSATSTTVVFNKDQFEYDFTVHANLADNLLLYSPDEATFNLNTCPAGPTVFQWLVNGQLTLNTADESYFKVTMPLEDQTFEVPMNPEFGFIQYIPEFTPDGGTTLAEGDDVDDPIGVDTPKTGLLVVDLRQMDLDGQFAQAYGDYIIEFPDGAFSIGGLSAKGCRFKYTYEALAVDFTYELTPAPVEGGTVSDLSTVTLSFPNSTYVTYSDNVARLTMPDGTVLKCSYPDLISPDSQVNQGLVLRFGKADTKWTDGVYTLTVNPYTVAVDVSEDNPNFEGLTVQYVYKAPVRLSDHLGLQMPSSLDCNVTSVYPGYYMGMVILGLDSNDVLVNSECDTPITMTYNDEVIGNIPLNVSDEERRVQIIGIATTEGSDDFLPGVTSISLYLVFAEDGADMSKFRNDGAYTVSIPDGAFVMNGVPMKGLTLTYNYAGKAPARSFEWSVEPAGGDYKAEPKDLLSEIRLTVKDAKYIYYKNRGGGKLTAPDGTAINAGYPRLEQPNTIAYQFGNKNTDWEALGYGTYTFSVAPGYVNVGNPYWDEYESDGNFNEDVTVLYNVQKNGTSSVTLIGVPAADSYSVYTVDGNAVLLNAAPEAVLDLEPGLYIINGCKTMLRK